MAKPLPRINLTENEKVKVFYGIDLISLPVFSPSIVKFLRRFLEISTF